MHDFIVGRFRVERIVLYSSRLISIFFSRLLFSAIFLCFCCQIFFEYVCVFVRFVLSVAIRFIFFVRRIVHQEPCVCALSLLEVVFLSSLLLMIQTEASFVCMCVLLYVFFSLLHSPFSDFIFSTSIFFLSFSLCALCVVFSYYFIICFLLLCSPFCICDVHHSL